MDSCELDELFKRRRSSEGAEGPLPKSRRTLRRIAVGASAVVAIGAAALLVGTPAQASSDTRIHPDPSQYNTHYCLDSNSSGSAYVLACNGGPYQNWSIQFADQGVELPSYECYASLECGHIVRIQDIQTGRYLDSNSNGDVYTRPDYGSSDFNQQWILVLRTSGNTAFLVDWSTNMALQWNGGALRTLPGWINPQPTVYMGNYYVG
jgi:hypothetical protein